MKRIPYLLVVCGLCTAITIGLVSLNADEIASSAPTFSVLLAKQGTMQLTKSGTLSESRFRQLFIEPYPLAGERGHAGDGARIGGCVVATDGKRIAVVPIWTWMANNKQPMLLCQATDDGSPPALSVSANTESLLLEQLVQTLREPVEKRSKKPTE